MVYISISLLGGTYCEDGITLIFEPGKKKELKVFTMVKILLWYFKT